MREFGALIQVFWFTPMIQTANRERRVWSCHDKLYRGSIYILLDKDKNNMMKWNKIDVLRPVKFPSAHSHTHTRGRTSVDCDEGGAVHAVDGRVGESMTRCQGERQRNKSFALGSPPFFLAPYVEQIAIIGGPRKRLWWKTS